MKQEAQYNIEDQEWLTSFQWIIQHESVERAKEILNLLAGKVSENDLSFSEEINTPKAS